ncbi:37S ribosomal protein S9, mitochondrial [Cytospora mali]|uniref:Small ribosomal subunit protein uS9m n=1 Tax=Cytospora mali TaxID=578113 RepID=A0A194W5M2_CYTMA|nr:37S ribosomal protein S9, mitochondrial [Valsa mali]
MASLRPTFTQLRGRCQASAPQWQQLRQMLQGLQISSKAGSTRAASTMPSGFDDSVTADEFAAFNMGRVKSALQETDMRGETAATTEVRMPSHARPLPVSPSYFSRQPEFNDSYLMLQKLMRQFAHLPTVTTDQLEKTAFRTLRDYRLAVGEQIKASEYAKAMTLVKRLHKIHPSLQPTSVKDALAKFKRDINPHNNTTKPIHIDKFGRALGVGKRKTSTARAWVVEGTGEVLVNGKSLADAFGRVHDRESAMWALKATQRVDKYNVWALVDGGGTTGQAEALTLAVAKALMAHEPALKPVLRRAGCVTRDPRTVERKKHGHLKARKKPAWVKR